MMREIRLGHPEDELRSSRAEIEALKDSHVWLDIKDHLEEVKQGHLQELARKGIPERDADFKRGILAIIEDLQGLPDMFIQFINDKEELENGGQ